MKKLTALFLLGSLICTSFVFSQTFKNNPNDKLLANAEFQQLFVASDGVASNISLYVGFDPSATDGIDAGLSESALPPPPPVGVFDARFNLTGGVQSYRDFRNGTQPETANIEHILSFQKSTGATNFMLDFTLPTLLGGTLTVKINDNVTGTIVNETFTAPGTHNYTLTLNLTELKITMQYSAFVVPVEFTSFTANTNGSQVILNWKTATETNNLGFEIERKSEKTNWSKIGYMEGKGTTTEPSEYTFIDKTINNASGKLYYRLKQMDYDGTISFSDEISVEFTPAKFSLNQNYPNPFNPATTIGYALPSASKVKLEVFNAIGQKVRTLVDASQEAGYFEVNFNASNLPSGIYFSVLTTESVNGAQGKIVKKMMLLK